MKSSNDLRVTNEEARELLYTLSPVHYIRSLGFIPYAWQEAVLKSGHKRKVINGARQAGKSTIVSALPCHTARFFPGSVSIILAATEQQAFYDMEKIKDFIARDEGYPAVLRDSDRLVTLDNKSWIMVVPATEKAARGPSAPRLILMDEASRIEDIVYRSGIIPMLTDNPECFLVSISTPNGKRGFFYESFQNPKWERYEIRSPWEVMGLGLDLAERESEEEYRARRMADGIKGYYSPRHRRYDEQVFNLGEMGMLMYRQEYEVEFVEPQDQVFDYADIERLMKAQAAGLEFGIIGEAEALEL